MTHSRTITPDRDVPTISFCDTETIRLPEGDSVVWDLALIRRTMSPDWTRITGEDTWCWQLPVDLSGADPVSLDIGGYYQRRWTTLDDTSALPGEDEDIDDLAATAVDGYPKAAPGKGETYYVVPNFNLHEFAGTFARLTHGTHFIGACGMFDANRLAPLLRKWRACPGWHYQVHDIEDIAAGWVLGRQAEIASRVTAGLSIDAGMSGADPVPVLPWSSDALAIALGVSVDEALRHTALGDARMVADMWDKVTSHQLDRAAR